MRGIGTLWTSMFARTFEAKRWRSSNRTATAVTKLALVTGTNAYVVTPIAREFGIEHVLAVQPETVAINFYRRLCRHTHVSGWQGTQGRRVAGGARGTWDDTITICYGDSINDLPLLRRRVTHPVVTNGDARLIAIAHERGWRTLQLFDRAAA